MRITSAYLAILALFLAGCSGRVVEVPVRSDCPSWANFPLDRRSNLETAYLGCSTLLNLEDSVDHPRDLVDGRRLGPRPAARDADSVKAYEAGSIKPPSRRPSATTGSGSPILDGLR